MKYYIELDNPLIDKTQTEEEDTFILIDKFEIHNEMHYTCPAKVIVIFAHDFDFDYASTISTDGDIE